MVLPAGALWQFHLCLHAAWLALLSSVLVWGIQTLNCTTSCGPGVRCMQTSDVNVPFCNCKNLICNLQRHSRTCFQQLLISVNFWGQTNFSLRHLLSVTLSL